MDKLVPVLTDLSKLSHLVKIDVAKETVYDKLVAKVNAIPLNNINTSKFVLKTQKIKFLILVVLLKRQIIILE